MEYRIIIVRNNKKKKLLFKGVDKEYAYKKYKNLLKTNRVLFPKKHNNYLKNKPVKFELLLVKEKEEDDTKYYIRNETGEPVETTIKSNKWSIMAKSEWLFEETFMVYGHKERMDTKEVIKNILMKEIYKKNTVKVINYIFNKLMIHNNDDFDIITCKCISDAKRLYELLKEYCVKHKFNKILFTGAVRKRSRPEMYERIVKKTGWKIDKLYRTTTRP